jgi:hypothetical protein
VFVWLGGSAMAPDAEKRSQATALVERAIARRVKRASAHIALQCANMIDSVTTDSLQPLAHENP